MNGLFIYKMNVIVFNENEGIIYYEILHLPSGKVMLGTTQYYNCPLSARKGLKALVDYFERTIM